MTLVSLWTAIQDPLQGKTSLSRVFWVYGLLGSLLVSAIGLFIDIGNEWAMRAYSAFGLIFSLYVAIATYRCASNCQSKALARLARISAVISLVALPFSGLDRALDLAGF
jgi:exosortase/archaeosortase